MAKKETLSYEAAMTRLEDIVRKIENNEVGIDRLTEQLKEAQSLIKQCKKQLFAVDKDIRDLLDGDSEAGQ